MAQRSEFAPISNVTTLPNILEIRRQNRVGFGNLDDLKNVLDKSDGYRHFVDGNYSVSILNYPDAKPMVVVHQENVDPSLVVEKTMQPTDVAASSPVSSSKTVFGPSDWFVPQQASSSDGIEKPKWKKRRLNEPAGTSANSSPSTSRAMEMDTDRKEMQEIDLTGLLYFVSEIPRDPFQIEYSANPVYKLAFNNVQIGFAVNLATIFAGSIEYTGILFQDQYNLCFALLVCSSDEIHPLQISNPCKYIEPISSCVYDIAIRMQKQAPFGAVTGIQACTNLKYLTLKYTNFVSDMFMRAVAAGCHKLVRLTIRHSNELTNEGLAALAVLPNLKRLAVNDCEGELSEGVTAIAREGRLAEFRAGDNTLSATCLKTIVRHCRRLRRLDIRDTDDDDDDDDAFTVNDAIEIVRLYGMGSMESDLTFLSTNAIWNNENVCEVIAEIEETNRRYFRVYVGRNDDDDSDDD